MCQILSSIMQSSVSNYLTTDITDRRHRGNRSESCSFHAFDEIRMIIGYMIVRKYVAQTMLRSRKMFAHP